MKTALEKELTCRECGNTFVVPRRRGVYPEYCTDECRRVGREKQQTAARKERMKAGMRVQRDWSDDLREKIREDA